MTTQHLGPDLEAELIAGFQRMPLPELTNFLVGMLHRRMLVHRGARAVFLCVVDNATPQRVHAAVSADDPTQETELLDRVSRVLREMADHRETSR